MCANDADDIGGGLLLRRGEAANAYLWRSGRLRDYCVLIHRGAPHVAEPTDLSEADAAAYWRDALALGRALTACYEPIKLNARQRHTPSAQPHLPPVRRSRRPDPAPGGPLPWDVLDGGRQDEENLQADTAALRELLEDA
ncbi:histidine triad (HIT) protein [Streptomyces griseoluteus]|uniref:histidine triad (HIT) protein n=1 Tax=Streptomyces griseoluteus TaxID=29306 RepID=UPI0036CDB0DC